ncbi:zinc finger, CCHC-type containing protein [Tanacetum coccineum]
MYNDNKGKHKHHDTKAYPNKKPKVTCWKCVNPGHLKWDCKAGNVSNKANGSGTKGLMYFSSNSMKGHNMFNKPLQVYYVTYVSEAYFMQDDDAAKCKDRCWFKTYESLNDGSILHIRNESRALVHGYGCVDLRLSSEKVVSFLGKIILDVNFLWKEERVPLLIGSPGASTTPSYSPGPSIPQSYSPDKHTIDSTTLPHELYNDMEKFSLE